MNYNDEIKAIGLTKKKVSEKLGISNVLLSYYINGTRPMPEHIENKLKEIINIYSNI